MLCAIVAQTAKAIQEVLPTFLKKIITDLGDHVHECILHLLRSGRYAPLAKNEGSLLPIDHSADVQ